MELFTKRINELLDEKHETQADMIRATGISKGSISKYFSGEEIEPKLKNLKKLADYFDASIDYIIGDSNIQARGINASELSGVFKLLSDTNKVKLMQFARFLKNEQEDK